MKHFFVADTSKLTDYGFVRKNGRYWWIYKNRTPAMWVCEHSQRLTLQSPSRECIAVMCEMYKDNVFTIVDDNAQETFNMKVTEEEMKMIFDKRKEHSSK